MGSCVPGLDLKMTFKHLVLLATLATCCMARDKRIGLFNVVSFPNDVCVGTGSRNGTCYTAEECSNRDGTEAGTCADGFGVCCVISIACGASSSDNCTYLEQTASTTLSGECSYTICPASTSITRIRLDFSTFVIAGPSTATTTDPVTVAASIGACQSDTFVVSGVGKASPTICGTNSGQHMIVDTDGSQCVTAAFMFGGDSSSRSYTIHVTQYDQTNEMGGPAGCLQFFSTNTGTISTFNWESTASFHLQNQDYSVCIRRNKDFCVICYGATTTYIATTTTNSFGLSVGTAVALADAQVDTGCSSDYILIPNGQMVATPGPASGTAPNSAVTAAGADRFCGRLLGTQAGAASMTICSSVTPFRLGVVTDGNEVHGAIVHVMASLSELSGMDANNAAMGAYGTQGFSIGYSQVAC